MSIHPILADAAETDVFTVDCPAREILNRLGSKWVSLIIVALADRPHYFGELLKRIEGVSKKMLAQTLRILESYGLVERESKIFGSVVKVRYGLTEQGTSLVESLLTVYAWAQQNTEAMLSNQEAYRRTASHRGE
ncbi:transcriptional regulator [Streptomyces dioscori]|uniref:Transcriptional regulator n=1 Tax=Streptomyces dioscori TaxID=2109333 RepID=A0A2P8Q2B4_9ACTN|nr:helix-turn-helix domain-containing protein [Streptomyces dioscori]PSM40396.1 transcriptional regulator [Streptomyces dioscori]